MIFRLALCFVALFLTSCLTKPFDVGQTEAIPVLNGVVDAGQPIAVFPGYSYKMSEAEEFVFDTAAVAIVVLNGDIDTLELEGYYSVYSGYSSAYKSRLVPLPGDNVSISVRFSDGTEASFKETIPLRDFIYAYQTDTLISPSGLNSIVTSFNITPTYTSQYQLVKVLSSKWDTRWPPQRLWGTTKFSDFDPANDPTNELDNIYTFQLQANYQYKTYLDLYVGYFPVDTLWYAMYQLSPTSWNYLRYTDQYLNDIYLSPFSNLPEFPGNVTNAAGFILVRVPHTFPIKVGE